MIEKQQLIPLLLVDFPEFQERWDRHVEWWKGEPAGDYNDMAVFVRFVMEDLFEKDRIKRTRFAFQRMEDFMRSGDKLVRDIIGYGFFETLQCAASWKPYGNQAFVPLLGPLSAQAWKELIAMWAGKTNLAEVIRAERAAARPLARFSRLLGKLSRFYRPKR